MTSKQKWNFLLGLSVIGVTISVSIFVNLLLSNSFKGQQANASFISTYSSEQVINSVNTRRESANLKPLIKNNKLMSAAQNKAEHMAKLNYFSHIHAQSGKKWSDFIKESEYVYIIAGENLANGFNDKDKMVQAWMESPTHRQNIMNPDVDETGVGIAYGKLEGNETIFVVQTFGKQENINNKSLIQEAKDKTKKENIVKKKI